VGQTLRRWIAKDRLPCNHRERLLTASLIFSWQRAARAFAVVLACGLISALVCAFLESFSISEGGSNGVVFMLGILGLILVLVATFPLNLIMGVMNHGMWMLVFPNFVFWALILGALHGFSRPHEQPYRVFRMDDESE
jgi:hypothetical protein